MNDGNSHEDNPRPWEISLLTVNVQTFPLCFYHLIGWHSDLHSLLSVVESNQEHLVEHCRGT